MLQAHYSFGTPDGRTKPLAAVTQLVFLSETKEQLLRSILTNVAKQVSSVVLVILALRSAKILARPIVT